jgi:hypothetical protein
LSLNAMISGGFDPVEPERYHRQAASTRRPAHLRRAFLFLAVAATGGLFPVPGVAGSSGGFTDITGSTGLGVAYVYDATIKPIEPRWICAGAAAGDIDGDGDIDLYLLGGGLGTDRLFVNQGDGSFTDGTDERGVELSNRLGCSPVFVDIDADGDLDLFVPSVHGSPRHAGNPAQDLPEAYPQLFINDGAGHFSRQAGAAGFASPEPIYAMAFRDLDGDDDLDAVAARWRFDSDSFVWMNEQGTFVDATPAVVGAAAPGLFLYAFTPTLSDFDDDGRADLALAADFGNSRVLQGQPGGDLVDRTDPSVISDENGMGGVVGDIDNDGDMDWFVSAIWDPDGIPTGNWGISGNRLYRNDGDFQFTDVTSAAGVREGYWGWGACLADLDNDGDLDLVHTNGFPAPGAPEFFEDPLRVYLNDGSGVFTEASSALGLSDSSQGRGVLCFDLEQDGDIDLLLINNQQAARLFRNDLPNTHSWLTVRLSGHGDNPFGVGARVEIQRDGRQQIRELRAGGTFVATAAPEVHFGLGPNSSLIERLDVRWPDGSATSIEAVPVDRVLTVDHDLLRRTDFETLP